MNCEEPQCKKKAELICKIHSKNFCAKHYGKHCTVCSDTSIKIEPLKQLGDSQIKNLNKKVSQIKSQIVEMANRLVLSIKNSMKNSLCCLNQQKRVLMNIIRMGKPENEFNELLKNVPSGIPGDQNSIQSLIDLERMLNIEVFNAKVQEIEKKLRAEDVGKQSRTQEIVLPNQAVNPVLESLEKLDLNGKIAWFKARSFTILDSDEFIREIKISKDSSFVFFCTN